MVMQHSYLRYECADAFGLVASSTSASDTTCPFAVLASSFPVSLSSSSSSSSNVAATTTSTTALSAACSQIVGYDLSRSLSSPCPCIKVGHRERLSGGVGTGRALNSDEVTCVDVVHVDVVASSMSGGGGGGGGGAKVATGWKDGTVRVFDLKPDEVRRGGIGGGGSGGGGALASRSEGSGPGCVHSLLYDDGDDAFACREPLVLCGHVGPVRCVAFERRHNDETITMGRGRTGSLSYLSSWSSSSRLASGGSDGSVVVWDVLAETGLFRLKGHVGPLADICFASGMRRGIASSLGVGKSGEEVNKYENATQHHSLYGDDVLVTMCSGDGLIKVWDLDQQCCVQTAVVGGGRRVCCGALGHVVDTSRKDTKLGKWESAMGNHRLRLVVGCDDGSSAVWSIFDDAPHDDNDGNDNDNDNDNDGTEQTKKKKKKRDTEEGKTKDSNETREGNTERSDGNRNTKKETEKNNGNEDDNLPLRPMGMLMLPPNVAASLSLTLPSSSSSSSSFLAKSIKFHPSGQYVGVHRCDSKEILIYRIRSIHETNKKRLRRLRRRREKGKDKQDKVQNDGNNDNDKGGVENKHARKGGKRKKGGLLDSDDSDMDEDESGEKNNGAAGSSSNNDNNNNNNNNNDNDRRTTAASDEFEYATTIRATRKIRGFAFYDVPFTSHLGEPNVKGETIRVACSLSTNALEIHLVRKITTDHKGKNNIDSVCRYETVRVRTTDMYGHPTGVRSLSLTSDDRKVLSVCKGVAKLWNVTKRYCLLSVPLALPPAAAAAAAGQEEEEEEETNKSANKKKKKKEKGKNATSLEKLSADCYGLCSAFLPDDRHAIVGTREGHLLVLDVDGGDVVRCVRHAHDGPIWGLDVRGPSVSRTSSSSLSSSLVSQFRFTSDGVGGREGIGLGGNDEEDEQDGMEAIAVVTGSADGSVKFWDLVRSDDDEDGGGGRGSHPDLEHSRTLKMSDDVVAVRYSHPYHRASDSKSDQDDVSSARRMVFVSTLDSKVSVFFDDTLKFYLCLYGHKLPVLAMDSSDDGAILATAGADKSVRIWGLDFGDCHRTLYGHNDSVTDIKFVRGTHYLFTSSKDGTIRFWDADRFVQVQVLEGHCMEANALVIGKTGAFVLTGGMDRQVRVWERTRDMVFPEEEKERMMEDSFDRADAAVGDDGGTAEVLRQGRRVRRGGGDGEGDDDDDDDEEDRPQSEAAARRSVLSVSSGDRIAEALETADQEAKEAAAFARSQRDVPNPVKRRANPLLLGMKPSPYVLWVLRSVRPAELEQSLLILPLGHVERLMTYLISNLRNERGVEVCARAAVFLVRAHQNQIIANRSLVVPLRELRRLLRLRLGNMRDAVGYNLAALRAVARIDQNRRSSRFVSEEGGGDVWAGLGLGSDVAAALVGKARKKAKR